ncbi:MAG: hypothetical protein AABY15_06685 [Nanoarchaeota archaeon]|mgnify:FL=1
MKDWEERNKVYGEECLAELKGNGFDTEGITPSQAITILIPSHAPENFYCDGEISHPQALARWKKQLADSGMKPEQVRKAVNLYFK